VNDRNRIADVLLADMPIDDGNEAGVWAGLQPRVRRIRRTRIAVRLTAGLTVVLVAVAALAALSTVGEPTVPADQPTIPPTIVDTAPATIAEATATTFAPPISAPGQPSAFGVLTWELLPATPGANGERSGLPGDFDHHSDRLLVYDDGPEEWTWIAGPPGAVIDDLVMTSDGRVVATAFHDSSRAWVRSPDGEWVLHLDIEPVVIEGMDTFEHLSLAAVTESRLFVRHDVSAVGWGGGFQEPVWEEMVGDGASDFDYDPTGHVMTARDASGNAVRFSVVEREDGTGFDVVDEDGTVVREVVAAPSFGLSLDEFDGYGFSRVHLFEISEGGAVEGVALPEDFRGAASVEFLADEHTLYAVVHPTEHGRPGVDTEPEKLWRLRDGSEWALVSDALPGTANETYSAHRGRLIVASWPGSIHSSDDGVVWTTAPAEPESPGDFELMEVDDGWVAVKTWECGFECMRLTIYTSRDGQTWLAQPVDGASLGGLVADADLDEVDADLDEGDGDTMIPPIVATARSIFVQLDDGRLLRATW
jgi:hypothetical protein